MFGNIYEDTNNQKCHYMLKCNKMLTFIIILINPITKELILNKFPEIPLLRRKKTGSLKINKDIHILYYIINILREVEDSV